MKPKYILCPGYVTSQTDGQQHYIGVMRLAELYGVNHRECKTFEPADWWTPSYWRWAEKDLETLIQLRPREDGNYTLPVT